VWIPPEIYFHLDADIMELCEVAGHRPRIIHTDPNTLNLISFVESSLRVTVLSTSEQRAPLSSTARCEQAFPEDPAATSPRLCPSVSSRAVDMTSYRPHSLVLLLGTQSNACWVGKRMHAAGEEDDLRILE